MTPGFVRGHHTYAELQLVRAWNDMALLRASTPGEAIGGALRGVCRSLCPFAR